MSIQNIKSNGERPNGYQALASRAAEFERQGLYTQASDMWAVAHTAAKNSQNKHWAQCRIDYCVMALQRNWKVAA